MTRYIALYRTAEGNSYAQGPFPSRAMAAMAASQLVSEQRDVKADVVALRERPIELGHVPLGLNEHGEGPVADEQAVSFVCLECGCPAVTRPQRGGKNALQRLTDDLDRALKDAADVRRDFREC